MLIINRLLTTAISPFFEINFSGTFILLVLRIILLKNLNKKNRTPPYNGRLRFIFL